VHGEALDGWTGGSCAKTCFADSECGTGGWCRGADNFLHVTPGFCLQTCASDSACRSGYQCYDRFFESHRICAPTGTGSAAVGAECTSVAQCAGGQYATCLTPAGSGYKDGYCTIELAQSGARACPAGSHLGGASNGFGNCVANCTTSPQCRNGNNGYACYDSDGDGSPECETSATGSGPVGSPCAGTWECAGGEKGVCGSVANGWPAGYCLVGCKTGACPTGSNCVQLNTSNANSFYCLKGCTATTGCRSGYTCKDRGGSTSLLECAP
jgi:hypothetical protein